MSHPMIDNPRFRGMTLPQARKLEQESRGFRDLSDEQVWALRMVHAHDCPGRPAEHDTETLRWTVARALRDQHAQALHEGMVIAWERGGFGGSRPEFDPEPMSVEDWLDSADAAITALAERPAEPDPDLVAAFEAAASLWRTRGYLQWSHPTQSAPEAMAAVAQARIDAAVNAERDHIRAKLFEELDGITSSWARAAIERVIDVVDQETEAAQ